MDEEQQQSDSKISVSSFFERVDSVEKVANSALSKSSGNFSIINNQKTLINSCLLYTSPSPRDRTRSRMPSSA